MTLPLAFALAATLAAPPPTSYRGTDNQLTVPVPRIDTQIVVDGVLDEPVWSDAAVLTGFSQYAPSDGRPADQQTEVLVWYSTTAIYFGIRARATPGSVRATLSTRDRIDTDDQVQIYLGTFNDGRQAWMFAVNPLGVQADGALVEGGSRSGREGQTIGREPPDLSPDFVYQSKGRVTAEGYDVEVRIPFKTLRFPSARQQNWGLSIVRIVKSLGHEYSWAPARRSASSFLGQGGTLAGMTDLRRGLVLDLNPAVTAKADGAAREDGAWGYRTGHPEFGANIRWGVTPNLTLNGTVNPDFSQIEADAGQFQYDPREALYYAEKRPFFLDGLELFSTPNQLIYTRRVVNPLAAVKLTGKVGLTSVAVLSAADDRSMSATGSNRPFHGMARVQHDVGSQSRIGVVFTDKVDGDRTNQVAAIDGRFAFKKIYTLDAQAAGSRTAAPDGVISGPLWQVIFNRNGRRFGMRYNVRAVSDNFHTASGFISRGGIAQVNLTHRLSTFGSKGSLFERWDHDVVVEGVWKYRNFVSGGEAQDRKLHLNTNARLRGGWQAGGSIFVETFGYDTDLYRDYAICAPRAAGGCDIQPFVGTPRIPNLDYVLSVTTPQFKTFTANAFWLWGHDENFYEWAPSDILFANYGLDWRPTEQLRVNASYQLQQYKRRNDGGSIAGQRKIPRLKVEYQLTRSIFFRFVGEYDAYRQDDLRDNSRTEQPLLVRNADTGMFEPALGFRTNRFRADWLFSYQPTPGTVIFAGYGSMSDEPDALRFRNLRRVNDGFFLKVSYLFRL
jgi:hypothetical protein